MTMVAVHPRPSSRAIDQVRHHLQRIRDDRRESHPGYFWLAYDWRNLLLACTSCNQPGTVTDPAGGKRKIGKHNRFPVADEGGRAWRPTDDLKAEQPLLIHPVHEPDPGVHLSVNVRTGFMRGETDRGRACIDIFALNLRERLPEERKKAVMTVRMELACLQNPRASKAEKRDALQRLQAIKDGAESYTLAARTYLDEYLHSLTPLL